MDSSFSIILTGRAASLKRNERVSWSDWVSRTLFAPLSHPAQLMIH
jgi:hypothetical protein